jgi:tRNA1(Val) A37 N6-methylase TrmN6
VNRKLAWQRQNPMARDAVVAAVMGNGADDASNLATTTDAFLGGRLILRQPADGYRAAIDPVLLAASVTAPSSARIVDLGCGIGTAGLCVLARLPTVTCIGVDIQAPLVGLATANAAANGLADRYQARSGSILHSGLLTDLRDVDQVIANPPYLAKGTASPSDHPIKALANVESDAMLADWVAIAAGIVKPGGNVTFIHRADRLPDLLSHMRDRLGSLVILPIQPKTDVAASRVIVRGRREKKAPAVVLPPFILHESDGRYTDQAEAILRGAVALTM